MPATLITQTTWDVSRLVDAIGSGYSSRVYHLVENCRELHKCPHLKDSTAARSSLCASQNCQCEPLEEADAFGTTPLYKASHMGDLKTVAYLVEQAHVSVDGKLGKGAFRTPLIAAVSNNQVSVAQYLLSQGANVEAKYMFGMTSLHLACDRGLLPMVRTLLRHRANLNAQDERGWTPLYHASQRGHLACIRQLVATTNNTMQDDDDDDDNDNNNNKSHETTKAKLPLGAPVWSLFVRQSATTIRIGTGTKQQKQQQQSNDKPPMPPRSRKKWALQFSRRVVDRHHSSDSTPSGSESLCQERLSLCNVNLASSSGRTPLHTACEHGRLLVVIYLSEHTEADSFARDHAGNTPLFLACEKDSLDIVEYLVHKHYRHKNDMDEQGKLLVDQDTNNCRETPLFAACYSGKYNTSTFLLNECGADINAKDHKGHSLLFWACQKGLRKPMDYLMDRGANINTINNQGWTPLGWACAYIQPDWIIDWLLVHGAGLDVGRHSALWLACRAGYLPLVQRLIHDTEQGKDLLDVVDPTSNLTPLAIAAVFGHLSVVRFLVEYSAGDLATQVVQSYS